MSKDPAFLFYPGDASNDTQFMNRLERGAYFDLVKSQRLFHGYSMDQLRKVLGKDFDQVWPSLELILQQDETGYFIGWVRESISNRNAFSKKQSERINKYWEKKKSNHGITTVIPYIANENENEIIENRIEGMGGRKGVNKYPDLDQVKLYFIENGYPEQLAVKAFNYYHVAGWKDSNGKQVRNWKQKMQSVWFKDENKPKVFDVAKTGRVLN